MTPMHITSAAYTHIGRRYQNEDALLVDSDLGLFAVADGMGGQAGGEVASKLAVGAVREIYRQAEDEPQATWPMGIDTTLSFDEALADAAIKRAHQSIRSHRHGLLSEMGSTLAMMTVSGSRAVIAHVGDSRIYRLRHGELSQLTTDHSFYNQLLAAGITDLPPRRDFVYSNIITRCLGGTAKSHPDVRVETIEPGDIFLLCTDGLIETLTDERIEEILTELPPDEAVYRLVREAFLDGGCDNITVVIARIDPEEQRHQSPAANTHPYVAVARCA